MICNTAFLKEQCDNDQEMVQTMVDIFINTAPDYLQSIIEAQKSCKFQELKNAAHGFLSSLKIMGAEQIVVLTQQIEHNIIDNKLESIEHLTKEVCRLTYQALDELNALKN
ncbi:MAG: HPt (histidine-containing phosphotransfer) domain-containing protein [Flavobacteriales bacterium]|jgi:HPt (histidine-containing phosphotransfer) domain-containing protein